MLIEQKRSVPEIFVNVWSENWRHRFRFELRNIWAAWNTVRERMFDTQAEAELNVADLVGDGLSWLSPEIAPNKHLVLTDGRISAHD